MSLAPFVMALKRKNTLKFFFIGCIIKEGTEEGRRRKITIQQKIMVALDIAGLTQAELAEKIGTSPAALSKRIKTGKFSDEDFQRMAAALGCEYRSGFYFPDGSKVE